MKNINAKYNNTTNTNLLVKKGDTIYIEKIINSRLFKITGKCMKVKKNNIFTRVVLNVKLNNKYIKFDFFINNPNIKILKKLK
jgi:hypothetical protein